MTWTSEEEQARKLEHDHAGHAAADDGGDDGRGVSRGASNRGPVVENVLKSETRQRPVRAELRLGLCGARSSRHRLVLGDPITGAERG